MYNTQVRCLRIGKKLKSHSNFTYSQLPRLHRSAFGWCTSFCFESKAASGKIHSPALLLPHLAPSSVPRYIHTSSVWHVQGWSLCWHHTRPLLEEPQGRRPPPPSHSSSPQRGPKKKWSAKQLWKRCTFFGGESNALLWTKTKPRPNSTSFSKNESLLEKPSPQNPGSSIPSPSPSPCKRRAGNSGSIQAWRRVTSVVMKAVCGVLWMKSSQGVGGGIRELVILSFGTHQQKWDAKRNFWDSFFTIFSKKSTIAKEVWWLSRICDGKHFPLNVFLKGWKAHAKINSKTFKYCRAKASSLENKSHPNCRTKDNLTPPNWICQIPKKGSEMIET